ncbi:MAG: hypothetical protein ACR2O0_13830 [Rhizobiaceae bacterium]
MPLSMMFFLLSVGCAIAGEFDGWCLPANDCDGKPTPIENDSFQTCGEKCEMQDPVTVRDMDALLYDVVCSGEQGTSDPERMMFIRQTDSQGKVTASIVTNDTTRKLQPCDQEKPANACRIYRPAELSENQDGGVEKPICLEITEQTITKLQSEGWNIESVATDMAVINGAVWVPACGDPGYCPKQSNSWSGATVVGTCEIESFNQVGSSFECQASVIRDKETADIIETYTLTSGELFVIRHTEGKKPRINGFFTEGGNGPMTNGCYPILEENRTFCFEETQE